MRKEAVNKIQGDNTPTWEVREYDANNNLTAAFVVTERPEWHADTLDEALDIVVKRITLKDEDLTDLGFTYDGHNWPMLGTSRENWSNIMNISEGVFPLSMLDKDLLPYSLTLAKREQFYMAAVACKQGKILVGNELKKQVRALRYSAGATIEDILNFIDPRN
jgi:hypothetical protein